MEYQVKKCNIEGWGVLFTAELPTDVNSSPKVQSWVGHSLLTAGLKEMNLFHDYPVYKYGSQGKPYLANYDGVWFNMAHCERTVVCVISPKEIGIDVEYVHKENLDIMYKVMNTDEIQMIEASDRPERMFTLLWTKKESLLKCTGEGIIDDMKEVLSTGQFRFHTMDDAHCPYVITMCRKE